MMGDVTSPGQRPGFRGLIGRSVWEPEGRGRLTGDFGIDLVLMMRKVEVGGAACEGQPQPRQRGACTAQLH